MDRGGWGARTSYGIKVILNVYDLSPVNEFIHPIGLGVFHTGVQIGASEYTFAGGAGIFDHTPLEPGEGATFREAIELGTFEGGQQVLKQAISELGPQFESDSYNVVIKNCNHFSDALSQRLLNKNIPGHVNRLANIGGCFAGCLPKSVLDNSGQSNAATPPASYQVSGGGGSRKLLSNNPSSNQQAFSGAGKSLGSSNNNDVDSSELSDRRERTRQARLARLGGSSS